MESITTETNLVRTSSYYPGRGDQTERSQRTTDSTVGEVGSTDAELEERFRDLCLEREYPLPRKPSKMIFFERGSKVFPMPYKPSGPLAEGALVEKSLAKEDLSENQADDESDTDSIIGLDAVIAMTSVISDRRLALALSHSGSGFIFNRTGVLESDDESDLDDALASLDTVAEVAVLDLDQEPASSHEVPVRSSGCCIIN